MFLIKANTVSPLITLLVKPRALALASGEPTAGVALRPTTVTAAANVRLATYTSKLSDALFPQGVVPSLAPPSMKLMPELDWVTLKLSPKGDPTTSSLPVPKSTHKPRLYWVMSALVAALMVSAPPVAPV